MYDAVIIGAGAAGMTAGIYLARRGKSALILEGSAYGGQIINSREIQNYPAIKNISGFDFATELYEQVLALGGKVEFSKVTEIQPNGKIKKVITAANEYECKNIIIATGAVNRKLGIEKEAELTGKGVSYCATCDGAFFRNKTTAVVGGGNTALDDAVFLSEICEKVYLIHRRDEFRGDDATVHKLKNTENVEFVLNSVPTKLIEDNEKLSGIAVQNNTDGLITELNINGLFIAVGQIPNTEFLKESGIKLDKYGYIIAGEDCRTNKDGVFAVGDCRTKSLRQLVTAAADGAAAATMCE